MNQNSKQGFKHSPITKSLVTHVNLIISIKKAKSTVEKKDIITLQ